MLARMTKEIFTPIAIPTIKDQTHKSITDPKEINSAFREYYGMLYSKPEENTEEIKAHIRDRTDLPNLTEPQRETLNALITEQEVGEAISHLKAGKAPGPDGFPSDLYKTRAELTPLLQQLFNHMMEEGNYFLTGREALIKGHTEKREGQ